MILQYIILQYDKTTFYYNMIQYDIIFLYINDTILQYDIWHYRMQYDIRIWYDMIWYDGIIANLIYAIYIYTHRIQSYEYKCLQAFFCKYLRTSEAAIYPPWSGQHPMLIIDMKWNETFLGCYPPRPSKQRGFPTGLSENTITPIDIHYICRSIAGSPVVRILKASLHSLYSHVVINLRFHDPVSITVPRAPKHCDSSYHQS